MYALWQTVTLPFHFLCAPLDLLLPACIVLLFESVSVELESTCRPVFCFDQDRFAYASLGQKVHESMSGSACVNVLCCPVVALWYSMYYEFMYMKLWVFDLSGFQLHLQCVIFFCNTSVFMSFLVCWVILQDIWLLSKSNIFVFWSIILCWLSSDRCEFGAYLWGVHRIYLHRPCIGLYLVDVWLWIYVQLYVIPACQVAGIPSDGRYIR